MDLYTSRTRCKMRECAAVSKRQEVAVSSPRYSSSLLERSLLLCAPPYSFAFAFVVTLASVLFAATHSRMDCQGRGRRRTRKGRRRAGTW
ncbi:hypothetical protein VTO73DRAFT_15065 [Trametes versicolor]